MTSSDVVSTAACWLTLSFQAAFTLENILLTACYMVVLHLAATHFPDWSWLLGPKTLDSHPWTTKAKKTVCFICLHLVSITLAAAFQLGAAIASRGFREGPHSDKGYWYLLQSTRFIVASYWAEMLFNESIRMPMIVHHLITNLIIAQLPVKGLDTTGLGLPYQTLACFWLLQANVEQITYLGLLGRRIGWEESRRNRILLLGANIAIVNKTISNIGVFATWYFQIQSSASGYLTFGFYICSAALAVKQFFTIRALRRMAMRTSAIPPLGRRVQPHTAGPAVIRYWFGLRHVVRTEDAASLACEMTRVAVEDTEGSLASLFVVCRMLGREHMVRLPIPVVTRRRAVAQTT